MTRLTGWLTLLALGAALALVVALGLKNRSLRAQYADLLERVTWPHAGMYVPRFEAVTLAGDSVTVGEAPDDGAQVLFFFTTTCPYCRASVPYWKRIHAALAGDTGVEVYGVQLDSLHLGPPYVRQHGIEYPVVGLEDRGMVSRYRIRRVPMTLVVDGEGRVRYARRGQLGGPAAADSVIAAVREWSLDGVPATRSQ